MSNKVHINIDYACLAASNPNCKHNADVFCCSGAISGIDEGHDDEFDLSPPLYFSPLDVVVVVLRSQFDTSCRIFPWSQLVLVAATVDPSDVVVIPNRLLCSFLNFFEPTN